MGTDERCDSCGKEFGSQVLQILYRIYRPKRVRTICASCMLNTLYAADDAGLIKWRTEGQ